MGHRLAGLILVLDGVLVALLGLVGLVVFRPIAAIEGRPPVDQTPYPLLIVAILLGLAYVWAGQRAIRGIRRGRGAGILLAALLVIAFGALAAAGRTVGEIAFPIGVAVVNGLVAISLARWPVGGAQHA